MNIAPKSLIVNEKPEDFELVEQLAEEAFGPGRFTRTAFRLREGIPHEPDLSFVTWRAGKPIASVKLTKIWIGDQVCLLLGPLVVSVANKNSGYGGELMMTAVNAAREAGYPAIILVGDFPYYQRFGFQVVKAGTITMPGPVDPARLLICPLQDSALEAIKGTAKPYC
ncbi:MAG: N-acetyltransferase [Pseudomonadota bacterium]